MELNAGIENLKGVGDKTAALFGRLGITTLRELLCHYPHSYDKFEAYVSVNRLSLGKICAVRARVIGKISSKKFRSLNISSVKVSDAEGELALIFFNMPYLKNVLKPDRFYIFRGIPQKKGSMLQMEQPAVYKEEDYGKLLNCLQPRYSLTKGLTNNSITKAVRQVLEGYGQEEEFLPAEVLKKNALVSHREALEEIHFPRSEESLIAARKRLVFEEFFIFLMQIRSCLERSESIPNRYPMLETAHTVRFLERLPFRLTEAQKKVWEEVKKDLQGSGVMNRLIQGDVGSGKTIIAVLALLMTAANGFQGALMAPTEVLARQHFEGIREMTKQFGLPFRPVLLIGSLSAKEKREIYEKICIGEANLIVGTHALIQEKAVYKNLALVVTDEQHRFGVRQREALAGKGVDTHVLVMSATPIPRTLAIILYGDLHISIIDELPADRLPIKNCVVNTSYRKTAYSFMKKEMEKGRQVYIICPMIEEGEMDELENVTDYARKLREIFPAEIQISCLHGKMKPAEKNRIMEAFGRGDIDILVSTTVIEVGINVPNATVMMVENAERFGLAQLHQLRGRVGRGREQSYCIFVSSSDNKQTMERLEILNRSNDGFYIAGEDLKLRGPGDLFGIRQSGMMDFKIGDIYQDAGILKAASEAVEEILTLNEPEIKIEKITI